MERISRGRGGEFDDYSVSTAGVFREIVEQSRMIGVSLIGAT